MAKEYTAPELFLPLTPGQIKFLRLVMEDHIRVSGDVVVRKRCKAILKKLDVLPPTRRVDSRHNKGTP